MLKHLRITVDGKAYDVVVEDLTDEPGGTLYPAPGTMAAAAQTARPAPVPSQSPAAPVAPPASAAPAAAGGGADDKLSPLAGVVLELNAKVGDTVKAGQQVAVIEAMKMKTSVSAHKDGNVTSVPVKVGDAVDAGQVLMTIS